MSDKAIKKVTAELKAKVINIRKHTTVGRINAYNMAVIGIQNYYCIATNIYNNLTDGHDVFQYLCNLPFLGLIDGIFVARL